MKHKKIYIDGLGLVDGHFSGVGQYILGILNGIDKQLDERRRLGKKIPQVKVVIPYDKKARFDEFDFQHITAKRFPIPFRYMAGLWHRGWMPWIDVWCGKGVYIFPRFVDMPLLMSKNAGLVIFDLSYELHREFSDEGNAQFLSKNVRSSVNRTSDVITISENAKREIVDFYKLDPKHVHIATPAVDQTQFYKRDAEQIADTKKKYGITSEHYILALSNLEPRKNLEALVDVYCRLPKKIRDDTALVLVGVSGWKTEALFEDIIRRVKEGYNIVRPSEYVADEDRPAIISGASVLVYPSHYEGFGMPPLEALACGVPVITADNSSLPEVVSKVGTMVSSNDRDALYSALFDNITRNDFYKKRAQVEGPQRARQFSWQKSASVFLKIAEEA